MPCDVLYLDFNNDDFETSVLKAIDTKAFKLSDKNRFCSEYDGVLYDRNGDTLICCPSKKTGSMLIPEGVKYIGDHSCSNTEITSLKLPDTLKSIGYRAFADNADDIQDTEDTHVLVSKIKSEDPANTLIVTSIQKMSNIGKENDGLKQSDLDKMTSKRIVFIIDECHRSTFGDMLITIKDTFPNALFFGFTGTPIQDENQKKMNTTSDIFGEELHRYSIADGIRDGNVLGFDPYKVMTYKDNELREAVALVKAKANNRNEALSDPEKKKIYLKYMDKSKISMITKIDDFGNKILGIEDYIPNAQYQTDEHTNAVVEDIINGWDIISQNSKFHAIFATSSIPEAINYYKLFKSKTSKLKVTCLFDEHIDNREGYKVKEEGVLEIIKDYNNLYEQEFNIASFPKMKKDIASRLAHKKPYERIELEPKKQIDILIVVNQMLTGFDSKWNMKT